MRGAVITMRPMRALFFAALVLAVPALADETRVTIEVGETRVEPVAAGQLICDDLTIVKPEMTPRGLALTGLKLGSTLCSVRPYASYTSYVYRITVVPAKPKPRPPLIRELHEDVKHCSQ